MQTALAVRDEDVLPALAALHVTKGEFEDSIRTGEWARRSCHPYDAPTFPGMSAHSFRLRRLGLLWCPRGWTRVNEHSMGFLLSPDKKIAITTCRGNEDTANPSRQPTTRFKKGGIAFALIRQNCVQLEFAAPGFGDMIRLKRLPTDATVYYLLVDRRDGYVYSELSVPVRTVGGFPVEWIPRIILGRTHVGPTPILDEDVDEGDDLDIDVQPKDQ